MNNMDKCNEISKAYDILVDQLSSMKNEFMEEMETNPGNYQDFTIDDALTWFVEGISQ